MPSAKFLAVLAGAIVLVMLLSFPPFMVIDSAEARRRHAALGHHPRWRPPAPAAASQVLDARFGPRQAGSQSALRVGVNQVRLGLELAVTALSVAAVLAGLRRRPGANESLRATSPPPAAP